MKNIKEINTKKTNILLFDDMINIKNFDPNEIKIDRKYYNDFTIYYIGYVTMKDHLNNIHSVNHLCLIFNKVDGYTEKRNENKYLVFASTDKNKEVPTKYTELWNKIKDMIEEIDGKLCGFKKGVIKSRFDSDDDLPLIKILKLHNVTIVFRSVFEEFL